jgi:hypothetical protein
MSERLKEEALKPELLQSIGKRMMVLPGLSLVGEADDHPTLRKIGDEAVESAKLIMDQYSAVDSFVDVHACVFAKLLESGAMVDDAFVKALQSNEGLPRPPLLPRESTFSKYGGSEDVQIETDNQNSALLFHRPSSFEQVSDSAKNAKSSGGGKNAGLDMMMDPSQWNRAGMDQLNLGSDVAAMQSLDSPVQAIVRPVRGILSVAYGGGDASEARRNFSLHVVRIAGTRKIEIGVDGLSRGETHLGALDFSFGDALPLHLSPLKRSHCLDPWLSSWFDGTYQIATPSQWFYEAQQAGEYTFPCARGIVHGALEAAQPPAWCRSGSRAYATRMVQTFRSQGGCLFRYSGEILS